MLTDRARYRNVLVIGTDAFSKILNWKDRRTCVFFGDGAGAVLLSADRRQTIGASTSTWAATAAGSEYIAGARRAARACPIERRRAREAAEHVRDGRPQGVGVRGEHGAARRSASLLARARPRAADRGPADPAPEQPADARGHHDVARAADGEDGHDRRDLRQHGGRQHPADVAEGVGGRPAAGGDRAWCCAGSAAGCPGAPRCSTGSAGCPARPDHRRGQRHRRRARDRAGARRPSRHRQRSAAAPTASRWRRGFAPAAGRRRRWPWTSPRTPASRPRSPSLSRPVDVLVNNAGLQHVAPLEEFPMTKWDYLVQVMLIGRGAPDARACCPACARAASAASSTSAASTPWSPAPTRARTSPPSTACSASPRRSRSRPRTSTSPSTRSAPAT